uniref:AB hydrolase-1 domain-containing protein n=1 Tax=Globisporangium ultimum (strain ATCC 200006 / CBS 805.95 / DAOM BR144) TaxID=431595 RepID=K3WGH3_GLOUD
MVLASVVHSVMLQTLKFLGFCAGYSSKNVVVSEFDWSYLERHGKEEDANGTVVVLHGFSAIKETCINTARDINKKFKVIIPDLPGHGRTTPINPLLNYSVDHQARRLHEFFDATIAPEKKIHLVGISMGGMIAGVYAATYPERVSSLTLVCPAGITMKNKSTGLKILEETGENLLLAHKTDDIVRMSKLISEGREIPHFIASIIAGEREKQLPVLKKIVSDCFPQQTILDEYIPRIRAKTLVMWGKQDQVLDVSCVETLEKKLAVDQKHVIIFDGCGHTVHHERHEECANAISEFITGKVPTLCAA